MASEDTSMSAITEQENEYISSILGLRDPLKIISSDINSSDSASNSVQHLLFQADYLWNVGKGEEATELITRKIRSRKDFVEEGIHGYFCRGLEQLCKGALADALEAFQQAAASCAKSNSNDNLLKTFFTERAVNIAFWMACSGQMLQSAQAVQELIENTPYAGGVLSFAMHMAGDSIAAEQVAQSAIRKGFDDPWTIHAVAHALSSQGRAHECALWLEQHRAKSSNCNAFMKGHMEFHLALCFIDTCDQAKLDTLIATNLWGTMSKDMKAEYWNAAALLNVLWKAEIHNVKLLSTQKSSDCIEEALQNVTDALSGAANKSKSLVFSLCIFRYTEGSQRDEWNKELIIISPNDESESDETQKVLSALASAISIVYHHGGGDANDNDKWEKAAKLIAPVADKLETLGASPEQREVLEDFVGLVGMMEGNLNRKKSKNENENTDGSIDLQAWYNRNQRPNVSFYERIMAGK